MRSLYAGGLLIAGGFTVMPERLLGRLISETVVWPQLAIGGAMIASGIWLLLREAWMRRKGARKEPATGPV